MMNKKQEDKEIIIYDTNDYPFFVESRIRCKIINSAPNEFGKIEVEEPEGWTHCVNKEDLITEDDFKEESNEAISDLLNKDGTLI